MTPPRCNYESQEQFYRLLDEAADKHIAMIDTCLLNFPVKFVEFEIGDFAHDGRWKNRSKAIFLGLTMNHDKEWCQAMTDMLLFTVKQCLIATFPFIQKNMDKQQERLMFQMPHVKKVIAEAIGNFFHDFEQMKALEDVNFETS